MNKKYRNNAAIETVDNYAEEIMLQKHSNHHRDKFFPMMINKMNYKIGAEIGVDKGEFSEHILSKSSINTWYCIDPWIDDFGSDYRPDAYNPDGSKRMQEALERLRPFKERAVPIRATSLQAAKQIKNNSLDICYIDGDHSLEGIYTDLYTWIHKVKCGGLMAGHDYKDGPGSGMKDYWGNQLPYYIKTVVDNFCNQYGFKLKVSGGRILSWYFVKDI